MGSATKTPPSPSVTAQLTEVYALVDELHEMTDTLRLRIDNVLSTLNEGEST